MVNKPSKKPTKSSAGKDTFTRNLVIGMIALVVGVAVIFSVTGNQAKNSAKIPTGASQADGYGIVFNKDALPVIDIWEDFQCPVCKTFESEVGEYLTELVKNNKAKVVYHMLSFLGPESVRAANAVACASDEAKFSEFHALLYQTQSTTENSGLWSNENLIGLGKTIGLNANSFENCVNDGVYEGWVSNIAEDGVAKNVNSTPTIYVNGKELDRATQYFNLDGFKAGLVAAGLK